MGADWWLFKKATEFGEPLFRHYLWNKKETSFGYGQNWKWVVEETQMPLQELVRRPTGGGVVTHGNDWTYCLVIPRIHAASLIASLDLYEKLHLAMGLALKKQSIATSLFPCPSAKPSVIPGDCFREPVGKDLMCSGNLNKLAGAAMKKSREGLLIQGTLETSSFTDFSSEMFLNEFLYNLSSVIGDEIIRREWPREFLPERNEMSRKFSKIEWKRDRSRV